MSDKPQQVSDVSRETSETDVINEIMDRAMPHIPDPLEEAPAPAEESSQPEKAEASAPPQKNKPSSVYIYLAVLFGAAFLMLLLAYFVQQRNNDAVMDDLRITTASRQELLEDIQRLEQENETLQADKQDLTEQLEEEHLHSGELQQVADYNWACYEQMLSLYEQENLLTCLERCADSGEWVLMGVMVHQVNVRFSRNDPHFDNDYLPPAQEARYLELREELFEKSGFMVMQGFTTTEDRSDYTEFPYVGEGAFSEDVYNTADSLCTVLWHYPINPAYAAKIITQQFQPDSLRAETLNSGAFKASTVAWFQEVKADLTAQGLLRENEDGSLELATLTLYIGEKPILDVSRETNGE